MAFGLGSNAIEILVGLRDEATGKLSNIEKSVIKSAESMKNVGIAFMGAGVAGIGVMTMFGREAVKAVESENRFNATLGESAEEVRNWSKQVSDSMSVSEFALRSFTASFYRILTQFGMGKKEALEMSKSLSMLVYDVAAYFDISPEEAFDKISKGMMGQTRALKELGIEINDAMVKQYAYTQGIALLGSQLTPLQEQLARYGLIMERLKFVEGEWGKSDTVDAKIDRLKERWKDITKILGEAMLPVFSFVADKLKYLADWFKQLDENTQRNIGRLMILASVGMILGGALMFVAAQIKLLNFFSTPLIWKILLIVAAFDLMYRIIALLSAALGQFIESVGKILHLKGMIEVGKGMYEYGMGEAKKGGIGALFEMAGVNVSFGELFKGMLGFETPASMLKKSVSEVGKTTTINANIKFYKQDEAYDKMGNLVTTERYD